MYQAKPRNNPVGTKINLGFRDSEHWKSSEVVEDFADQIGGWFWEMDAELRFTYVTKSIKKYAGIDRENLYGKTRDEIGGPDTIDGATWLSHLELLRRREPFEDFRFMRAGAADVQWMSTSGHPVFGPYGEFRGYRGVGKDITAEVAAQSQVKQLRSAIENQQDLFVLWDDQDRLVYANRRFREINKAFSEFVEVGTHFEDHIRGGLAVGAYPDAGDDPEGWYAERLRLHREGNEGFEIERQDGRRILIRDQRLPDGSTATTSTDVTRLFKAEIAMREALAAAEEANNAKSSFLASMSHEIRTPMNGVLGMAGLLLDTELTEEQRGYARQIADSGDLLLTLLNDILDLSKIEAGKVDLEEIHFNLEDMLQSVAGLWQPRFAARGVSFEVLIAPNVNRILLTDPTRVQQIVFNLVSNAAKFTEQGSVSIHVTQNSNDDGSLETRICVADTGIGIARESQARLFEKFAQADNSVTRKYGGTGLGLSICEQLCKLLGGEIGMESEPGEGSQFWFTIRCRPGSAEKVGALIQERSRFGESDIVARPLRLLVAEDDRVNQTIIRAILENSGHDCDVVADGVEALTAVASVPYDAVLMDVQMPNMDGLAAARRIRELPGRIGAIPIVALTANAMSGDREACLQAGMDDYVGKPINKRELSAALARIKPRNLDDETDSPKQVPAIAASSVDGTPPILKEELLWELADLVGWERLSGLSATLATDVFKRNDVVADAAKAGDLTLMGRQVHSLKSALGQFGAARAEELAAEIEALCRGGHDDRASKLVPQLITLSEQSVAQIRQCIASNMISAK